MSVLQKSDRYRSTPNLTDIDADETPHDFFQSGTNIGRIRTLRDVIAQCSANDPDSDGGSAMLRPSQFKTFGGSTGNLLEAASTVREVRRTAPPPPRRGISVSPGVTGSASGTGHGSTDTADQRRFAWDSKSRTTHSEELAGVGRHPPYQKISVAPNLAPIQSIRTTGGERPLVGAKRSPKRYGSADNLLELESISSAAAARSPDVPYGARRPGEDRVSTGSPKNSVSPRPVWQVSSAAGSRESAGSGSRVPVVIRAAAADSSPGLPPPVAGKLTRRVGSADNLLADSFSSADRSRLTGNPWLNADENRRQALVSSKQRFTSEDNLLSPRALPPPPAQFAGGSPPPDFFPRRSALRL